MQEPCYTQTVLRSADGYWKNSIENKQIHKMITRNKQNTLSYPRGLFSRSQLVQSKQCVSNRCRLPRDPGKIPSWFWGTCENRNSTAQVWVAVALLLLFAFFLYPPFHVFDEPTVLSVLRVQLSRSLVRHATPVDALSPSRHATLAVFFDFRRPCCWAE